MFLEFLFVLTILGVSWVALSRRYSASYKVSRLRFQNQVVVITGASSGLGKEFAKQLYANGAKIIMAARKVAEMEKIKTELTETSDGHPPKLVALDLANEDTEQIEKIARDILDIHGHVDIVINNAGLSSRASVLDTKIDVDRRMMFVNYINQIAMTKVWLGSMVQRFKSASSHEQNCHIVAISSVQGRIGLPQRSSYSATKHALQAFYDSLRAELSSQNIPIDITVMSPGYIKTNLSLNAMSGDGSSYGKMDKTTASGAEPSEVVLETLWAIENRVPEVVSCPLNARALIQIRTIVPSLYFWVMSRYAKKNSS